MKSEIIKTAVTRKSFIQRIGLCLGMVGLAGIGMRFKFPGAMRDGLMAKGKHAGMIGPELAHSLGRNTKDIKKY